MNKKYIFLATEGPHDQAAIGKLLQISGFQKFNGTYQELDSFWDKFVMPYPNSTQRVYFRIEVPSIYFSSNLSIAVFQGGGSTLMKRLISILTNNPQFYQDIHAFGVIVDTDQGAPSNIAKNFSTGLRGFFSSIPETPGIVSKDEPKTGIYVLPDNLSPGTLDSVLVKCADCSYPEHLMGATRYLNELGEQHKIHWGPFHYEKALIAAITSVLLPGATNTASISSQETKWICEESIASIQELQQLIAFLKDLIE